MDEINAVGMAAMLPGTKCALSHGKHDTEDHPAVDYLMVPMGYIENNRTINVINEMSIPICADCAEAIAGDEWVLFYCLDCGHSAWALRELSRITYTDKLVFFNKSKCPHCRGKV